MTRIAFDSESCANSATGPALTMVSLSVAACAREARKRTARTAHFFMDDIVAPENDSRCRLRHLTASARYGGVGTSKTTSRSKARVVPAPIVRAGTPDLWHHLVD